MRTEKEIFDLILDVAKSDERIRAVLLAGSRAVPTIPKDKYQDFDIAYFVSEVAPFYNNLIWIEQKFGKPSIMQLPELMSHPLLPPVGDGHFAYLMIFDDGIRIDLSIASIPYVEDEEPAVILLDKDGCLPIKPSATDRNWYIEPPTENLYRDCCNEFWWCLNNVGKGIARDELPYVMEMYNHYVRDMLNQMVEWFIGVNHGFSLSTGKMGKYFKKYLPVEHYEMYVKTYPDGEYQHIWSSVFTSCMLFRHLAQAVGSHFGFNYNQSEDTYILAYLHEIN
jgi:aminoglycoside 6-adenylyltransferase